MAATQFAFCILAPDDATYTAGATVESKAPSGTAAATTAAADARHTICRVATDTAVYVSFGSAPDASIDTIRFMVPAGAVSYFRIASGDKGSVVTV